MRCFVRVLFILLSFSLFEAHAQDVSPDEPRLIVIVHGYDPIMEEFGPLQKELIENGHTIVFFRYNYKRCLDRAADSLVGFVKQAHQNHPQLKISVFGHSVGGLVARKAMTKNRVVTLADSSGLTIRLVTAATPFGGFKGPNTGFFMPFYFWISPSHLDLASLWRFIKRPGALGDNIQHIKIVTLENQQQIVQKGKLISDDTVSEKEQIHPAVDQDPYLFHSVRLEVGHVGILTRKAHDLAQWLTDDLSGLKR